MKLVVSDMHFGAGKDALKLNYFEKLHREYSERASKLILLGDIFDFWFEYESVVFRYHLPLIALIERFSKRMDVVYVAGNHDLWIDGFFENMGVKVVRGIYMEDGIAFAHGDDLKEGFKTRDVLTNPILVGMFRMIHPDIGWRIAKLVSRMSRNVHEDAKSVPEKVWQYFQKHIKTKVLVMGHLHIPTFERKGDRMIVCIGDWVKHFTFATIEGNTLSVRSMEGEVVFSLRISL